MIQNYVLLMMGGVGSRFGADRPKQFIEVKGKPVFLYILDALNKSSCINGIVIVCHEKWIDFVKEHTKNYEKLFNVVAGGDCRSKSVFNGLKEIKKFANDEDNVLMHDATHPHLDTEKLPLLIEAINKQKAATMTTSIFDTCYLMDQNGLIDKVIDRKQIAVGASPEGFKFGIIYSIYSKASNEELEAMTSAGAILLEHGIKMATIHSDLLNLKITYSNDMELFKILCDTYYNH